MPDTIQVRIRLARELDKRLKHAAVDADILYNDLIRQLLTQGLDKGYSQAHRLALDTIERLQNERDAKA
jgi:O-methyltransferase involved in polyketide biosynthesis